MTFNIIGYTRYPQRVFGDTPESALAMLASMYPRETVHRIETVKGDQIRVRDTERRSAYGAYIQEQAKLPRDPRRDCIAHHMHDAVHIVGYNAPEKEWQTCLTLLQNNCPFCSNKVIRTYGNPHPKKAITNQTVTFKQKSRAHYSTDKREFAVSEHSLMGNRPFAGRK